MRRFLDLDLKTLVALLAVGGWTLPAWAQALPLPAAFWAGAAQAWLAAMLVCMSGVVMVFASQHDRERSGWFLAGMMMSWVMLRAGTGTSAAGLRPLLMTLLVLNGVQFLLRQVNTRVEWISLALSLQCLVVPLSLFLAGSHINALGPFWHAALLLELVMAMGWVLWLRCCRLQQGAKTEAMVRADLHLMAVMLLPTMLALLAELVLSWWDTALWLAALPWLGLALPLTMMALGLQMVFGVTRARAEAERHVAQVEQRTQDKLAEAERTHAKQAELKLEQVTERERKRIAADLHDDLGAKLLTIVHTSESDRISTLAREALEEMRLSVRGLTGKPVHLIDALGDWRAEVVSRLGQANILAEWKSPAEDVEHTLQARAYVQTTRILRESVSNIIKHSGATHAVISCSVQEGDFVLRIQDNGQGIPAELDGRLDRGHGMASMKSRAKQMHGQCLVESGPGWGTLIRLTIPLKNS
jgi:signal transduction histidine kinase